MEILDDKYLEILFHIEKHPREVTFDSMLKLDNKDDYIYLIKEPQYLKRFYLDDIDEIVIGLSPKGLNYLASFRANKALEKKLDKRHIHTRIIAWIGVVISIAAVLVAWLT